MIDNFPDIVDYKFTAQMEQELDTVESGNVEWVNLLDQFYSDFDKTLKKAKTDSKPVKAKAEPKHRPQIYRKGRYQQAHQERKRSVSARCLHNMPQRPQRSHR